jgi:hypothetical protein
MRNRVLFVSVLLLGAIAMSALASGNARRVVGNCTKSQVRPTTIVIACADDNLALTKLHWGSFGGASAVAGGQYYVNGCTPNCAAGKFHFYPITLIVSAAAPCSDKHDDYRRVSVSFTGKRPPGQKTARERLSLSCPLPG